MAQNVWGAELNHRESRLSLNSEVEGSFTGSFCCFCVQVTGGGNFGEVAEP